MSTLEIILSFVGVCLGIYGTTILFWKTEKKKKVFEADRAELENTKLEMSVADTSIDMVDNMQKTLEKVSSINNELLKQSVFDRTEYYKRLKEQEDLFEHKLLEQKSFYEGKLKEYEAQISTLNKTHEELITKITIILKEKSSNECKIQKCTRRVKTNINESR